MIGSHTASPTTSPRCSRNPAIRGDVTIARTVVVDHDLPDTGGTPDSLSHAAIDRADSPASIRATIVRTTSASTGSWVILSAANPNGRAPAMGHPCGCDLVHLAAHPTRLRCRLVRSHRRQHSQHQQPVTVRHIDRSTSHEPHMAHTGSGDDLEELLQLDRPTSQPISVIDDHRITPTFGQVLEHRFVARAASCPSTPRCRCRRTPQPPPNPARRPASGSPRPGGSPPTPCRHPTRSVHTPQPHVTCPIRGHTNDSQEPHQPLSAPPPGRPPRRLDRPPRRRRLDPLDHPHRADRGQANATTNEPDPDRSRPHARQPTPPTAGRLIGAPPLQLDQSCAGTDPRSGAAGHHDGVQQGAASARRGPRRHVRSSRSA